jgi:hypothetical protein
VSIICSSERIEELGIINDTLALSMLLFCMEQGKSITWVYLCHLFLLSAKGCVTLATKKP